MNYKDFTLEDWIGHISGAIEDERELDGNEMRDLVEFLSKLPKWIPVSEGAPKEDGEYLLWGKIDEDEEEHQFIGDYVSGCDRFGVWLEQFDNNTVGYLGREFFEYKGVVAWRSLPTGYQRKGERK